MQRAYQLMYIQTIDGNHYQYEKDIINSIKEFSDCIIYFDIEKITITRLLGMPLLEAELVEIEVNLIQKEYGIITNENQFRMMLAGDLTLNILSASKKREPLTMASFKKDGFAIQFELKSI